MSQTCDWSRYSPNLPLKYLNNISGVITVLTHRDRALNKVNPDSHSYLWMQSWRISTRFCLFSVITSQKHPLLRGGGGKLLIPMKSNWNLPRGTTWPHLARVGGWPSPHTTCAPRPPLWLYSGRYWTRVELSPWAGLRTNRQREYICIYFHRQMKYINIRWAHPCENEMKLLLQLQRRYSWEISLPSLKNRIN
jgi:hypothetical protein